MSASGDLAELEGPAALAGQVSVPGDKSVSHRALLLGALSEVPTTVTGCSTGGDVRHTLEAVRALGAAVEEADDGTISLRAGRSTLRVPSAPLDCGNSGTGMRLLAGLVATLDGATTLVGDASLSSRPMDRVAVPLGRMGATVDGRGSRCLPPITVHGGPLRGIDYTLPVPSAQVKSAILLAGLAAAGGTVVREPVATRRHTEDLLSAGGADISVWEEDGVRCTRVGPSPVRLERVEVAGDPSQLAFWVVAALCSPGSEVESTPVVGDPERTGFLGVLARMGADLDVEASPGGAVRVRARSSALSGTQVDAAEIPSLDEVPILAVAAACASGETVFRGVGELRVKESDRLEGTVALLAAFGAASRADGEDLVVAGGSALRAGAFDARGDHRLAMSAAVCATLAAGTSRITGWASVATSYPGFLETLVRLGGHGEVR